jgi:hypothetical protein
MSNNELTLIEQFVIECGKYGDTAQIPDEVIEKYISKERANIRIAELDAIEITIIKHCAEEATLKASAYADGYAAGYKRAIELTKWAISNLIPPHNEQP